MLLAVLALTACTPMEEKRDAHMLKAREFEQGGQCAEAAVAAREALDLDPGLAEAYLIMGRCDLKANKRADASGHYARVLELTPDSIEALMALSRIALLNNEPDKADGYTQKAWDLGDRSRELTVLRSGVLMEKGDYTAAIPLLEEAVSASPDDEEALIGLASAYINTDNMDKARELLQKGQERFPDSPAVSALLMRLAMQEKDWALAEDTLRKLMAKNPGREDVVIQLADVLGLAGKAAEVPGLFRSFLEGNPTAVRVRLALISMEADQSRFDNALELIDKAPEQTAELTMAKANILAASGRVDESMGLLKQVAENPRDNAQAAEAHMGLAEIHLARGAFDDAEKELNQLLGFQPDNLNAVMLRGRVHLTQRELKQAIADFETVVDKQPHNHAALLALADAQFMAGNASLAENLVTSIIQRAPAFGQAYMSLANLYLMQGKPEAALVTLKLGHTSAPKDTSIPLAQADLLTNLKRYKEAEKTLKLLADDKNTPKPFLEQVLYRLAGVYGSANDHKNAVGVFDRLLALNNDDQRAAEGRVRAQIAGKQEKAALAFAEKRQKARPKDAASAYLTGEAALAAKDIKKAESAYKKAVELAPQWERPLMTMVQIYMATKRMDQAVALCREAMGKAPDAAGPGMILGMVHEQKNDPRAAEEVYRNVLIKHPDMLPAANNLAALMARNKPTPERLAEAEELAKKAATGGSANSLDTLGWVQHLRGNNAEAEVSLRKALEVGSDNPHVAYHLAAVLAAQNDKGKKDEASTLLQATLKQHKQFPMKGEAEKLLKKLGK